MFSLSDALPMQSYPSKVWVLFFNTFCLYFFFIQFFVVEISISIHIITYFNDKSGGELFTLNSCRRDNMEKRERDSYACTHTHTHTHTHTRTHTLDRKEW